MNTEMQMLALDDSSLDSVSGGRRKHYYFDDVTVNVSTISNTTTVSNSTVSATNGNVNIGNVSVDQSKNTGV